MSNRLTCPECKRLDAMEHRGNGFYYCLWRDCHYMVDIRKYKEPKIKFHFEKFRKSLKPKIKMV